MKIQFVLDLVPLNPMGGVKIIFKYAEHFAEAGHDVSIILAPIDYFPRAKRFIPYCIRKIIVEMYFLKGPSWFKLHKTIRIRCIDKITDSQIPDADVIFATAVGTAKPISMLGDSKGKKLYLIQDYENWRKSNDEVNSTYALGLHNIVVSKWLKEIVDLYSQSNSTLISNPIDTEIFRIIKKPEIRNPHSIAMIRQTDERKGFKYGLKAIELIKEKYPDTECRIFSIYPKTSEIPEWIEYSQNAKEEELVDIYNSSAVFLCSSTQEGYGLCGAESMACGCALVSTDYQGVHSYASPGEDVLLSPVKDAEGLAKNIALLFDNSSRRIEMAYKGNLNIQNNSWKEAYRKIDNIVK